MSMAKIRSCPCGRKVFYPPCPACWHEIERKEVVRLTRENLDLEAKVKQLSADLIGAMSAAKEIK